MDVVTHSKALVLSEKGGAAAIQASALPPAVARAERLLESFLTQVERVTVPPLEISVSRPLSSAEAQAELAKYVYSQDPRKVFKLGRVVGVGSTSQVYKAIHREKKKTVAVKLLALRDDGSESLSLVHTVKEVRMLRDIDCEWVLKYYGCYRTEKDIWCALHFHCFFDLTYITFMGGGRSWPNRRVAIAL